LFPVKSLFSKTVLAGSLLRPVSISFRPNPLLRTPAEKCYYAAIVIRFLKNRLARESGAASSLALGSLELELMEILWPRGESSVRDAVTLLSRPLAYTTVMTTLDRLFKKGLLHRRKADRAFVYSPVFSREEWERKRAGNLVAGFLSGPHPSRQILLSCLLDAVGEHDASLLDELEKKIRERRKEISRQGEP
jgi:predicted transcriptional regulator